MSDLANVREVVASSFASLQPPPDLTLSEWADEYFYLSAESAAEPGRWKTLPYQKGIMDAFTDPRVEQVSVMKSARVGWTKIVNALIGYSIHQDPAPIMVVQPTVDDAKGYSKEEIAPMLRDCPVLSEITFKDDEGPKSSANTILHKRFPGGVLSLVGANSGTGFRRVSRKRVLLDEVDAYPPSAGSDGDQVKLAFRRAEYYWDRKLGAGSTPLVAGRSRIEQLFEAGDQRRFYVPCPQCNHMDYFVFTQRDSGGHFMQFEKGRESAAHFVCSKNGCVIEHKDKRWMVERGEWRASKPFKAHASFHIWAAYSYSPNADWGSLAEEFTAANKEGPEKLRTFVNTVLGETWKDRGDAPEWERLFSRRESYPMGSVPPGVIFLTCGVDVQKDRFVYEVVGWGKSKENWSIDCGVIAADTASEASFAKLDELLGRTFPTAVGEGLPIRMLAIDSGFNTQMVYSWARRHPMSRVIATKGHHKARMIIGSPSPVEVRVNGKSLRRGYKVWSLGVDIAKAEFYGWLRLPTPEKGRPSAPGWCHFPEYGDDYFKQITSEQIVPIVKKQGYTAFEWQLMPGRENHYLDCRIYARAAAALLGLDKMHSKHVHSAPAPEAPQESAEQRIESAPQHSAPVQMHAEPRPAPRKEKKQGSWLTGGGARGSWLKKRR